MEIIKKLSSQKIILFTLLLIINSCGVYVQFDYDSDVNFNNYNSYSFYESEGLKRSNDPDILVTFETHSKERVYMNNYFSYGWNPFFYRYPYSSAYSSVQGTLYINFIDSKNQQLVWQGKGIGVLNEYSKDRDKMIGNFVESILEKFPPTAD